MSKSKKYLNEVYDGVVITVLALATSMASKQLLKSPLGTPDRTNDMIKLAVAVSIGNILRELLEEKDILPTDPLKGS